MENITYFLVIERRLGDYNIIDINKLDICNDHVASNITAIDSFTCQFTENELKEAISRSNMIQDGYLEGDLKIISSHRHNLRVLTKDIFLEVDDFQNNPEEIDREFKNKLFGGYKKIIENNFEDKAFIRKMLERFKESLRGNNKGEIFKIIEEIPYPKNRLIYFSIYDEKMRRREEKLRKLEKLDDGA